MASSSNLTAQADELNLFSLPLVGRTLIEASAGTGKTYSLAFIYLRLLLGLGENGYQRPLSVDEILVVTFTKAATEELRYRIRQNIYQLRMACILGYHKDEDYQNLINLIDNKELALKRLLSAEQNMDEAAIFTIHSFCQRILTTYAFEVGILFKQTLLKDESTLYLKIVQDFWRQYFTPMPVDIARVIWQNWNDPEALLKDIYPYIHGVLPDNVVLSQEPLFEKITHFHHDNISKIQLVKNQWLAISPDIETIISTSGVSKRSYSKSHLPRWIASITSWATHPTTDYFIPNELSKFTQTELINKTEDDKNPPVNPLFTDIEQLLEAQFSLRNAILFDLVYIINEQITKEKLTLAQIGFNDLLNYLHQSLFGKNGQFLAEQIMTKYPVAMIDEFQDTDPIQYQIFDRIYQDKQNSCLLLIGDPKQAIYGFRGADIFTYIRAKSSVDHHFTMLTNWRSTAKMVQAINSLFSCKDKPFIFEAIPFMPMNSAPKNQDKGLFINHQEVEALSCYLLPEMVTSNSDYLDSSAEYCAQQICDLLSSNTYFLNNQKDKVKVNSSDIAILVRTGREAEIIQQKLNKRNIKSVYMSNHKSVFETLEAREILRILQAVLTPMNENYLFSALATRLIGVAMDEIERLSDEPNKLDAVIEEFSEYQTIWLNYGVLVMLRRLMNRRHLAENLLSIVDGERIVTNFMHLGELLQEVAQEQDTPHALIRWLTKQINEPDQNLDNHEQRLESDENLVNIITIHKSKGLEYPIVFLPFIGLYRESDSLIYHDPNTYLAQYAYVVSSDIKALIEQERLAEDLRLLYVALTRSIYHCCVGIAGLKKGRSKELSLINSAIGYLLLEYGKSNYEELEQNLSRLEKTALIPVEFPIMVSSLADEMVDVKQLTANVFKRKLDNTWRVTSYSGLQQSSSYSENKSALLFDDTLPKFDIEVLSDNVSVEDEGVLIKPQHDKIIYDIHHFPKGAIVGTLLHECFETVDFKQADSQSVASFLVSKLSLDENWQQPLSEWFDAVLHASLANGISLAQISLNQRLNELQFYLPIHQMVSAIQLDQLCKAYDPLSKQCEALDFLAVRGMLKGFIDMVFEWQGKYYIVDYKSNFLGESTDSYTQDAINQAMCEHRYDLQYQLYTLALHRYLRSRIPNYQYRTHFGGVYYLFVRGMTKNDASHGIFYHKPEQEFIEKLDQLFG